MEPNIISITSPATLDQMPRASQAKGVLVICFALSALGLTVSASVQKKATFTTFDVPAASSTVPASINPGGVVTGYYFDASSINHGFLRGRDGSMTTFDDPNASSTVPTSINPAGLITGYISTGDCPPDMVCEDTHTYGFLRSPDGTFTEFGWETYPVSINAAGVITGYESSAPIFDFAHSRRHHHRVRVSSRRVLNLAYKH